MDIDREILPRLKSLQQVFPNHDTLSIFIRSANLLGDDNDEDLRDLEGVNKGRKRTETVMEQRARLRMKEREMDREWHLNRPAVSWNHHQMKHNYPKYTQFLEEFTLRAKRSKMWTKRDLAEITTKQMEGIVGEALRRK